MKIRRIFIKNYRSIRTLEFYPSSICGLVGENNAGKTTLLSALNLLLGETWPSKRSIQLSDYHNADTDHPIHIEVEFDNNPDNIKKIWYKQPWEGAAETKIQFGTSETSYNLNNAWREKCALVYLDANRTLEHHLGQSPWGLFGRIVRRLDENFKREYSVGSKVESELRGHFEEAFKLLQTPLFNDFESTLKESFAGQIRRTSHKIKLDLQTFDPSNYYRAVRLLMQEYEQLKSLDASGQGMKNMVILALFRTYAKVFRGDAIIAIEEPELFLHPHAQRSLYSLFQEVAKGGTQVFFSTHSGAFIDIETFDHIAVVECRPYIENHQSRHEATVRQVKADQLLSRRKDLYPHIPMTIDSMRERYGNICTLDHSEAFFSRKVILVEGLTEKCSLPIYASALGYDFDTHGVSIVSAEGKGNLDMLYQLFSEFGFPIYLIFDGDLGSTDSDKLQKNCDLLRLLGLKEEENPHEVITSSYAILQKDYESAMKKELESQKPGLYEELKNQAGQVLGGGAGKGLIARFIAKRLVTLSAGDVAYIPKHIKAIITHIKTLGDPAKPEAVTPVTPVEEDVPF